MANANQRMYRMSAAPCQSKPVGLAIRRLSTVALPPALIGDLLRLGYMTRSIAILSLLLVLISCGQKETTLDNTPMIKSAEDGIEYLESHPPSGDSFQFSISDSFTFAGKPDTMGAGMAVLLDRILEAGYEPDGFEQKSGFRLYRYKKVQ